MFTTDLETYLHDYAEGTIYRVYKYKKVYTPYEQDQKFSDESMFENGNYPIFAYIVGTIELPDGDVLIKFLETEPLDEQDEEHIAEDNCYFFEKLSEISIKEYDVDNKKS